MKRQPRGRDTLSHSAVTVNQPEYVMKISAENARWFVLAICKLNDILSRSQGRPLVASDAAALCRVAGGNPRIRGFIC